jgi:hypothetical protein
MTSLMRGGHNDTDDGESANLKHDLIVLLWLLILALAVSWMV